MSKSTFGWLFSKFANATATILSLFAIHLSNDSNWMCSLSARARMRLFVCVCVCERDTERESVCVCVRAWMLACVCACVRASLPYLLLSTFNVTGTLDSDYRFLSTRPSSWKAALVRQSSFVRSVLVWAWHVQHATLRVRWRHFLCCRAAGCLLWVTLTQINGGRQRHRP